MEKIVAIGGGENRHNNTKYKFAIILGALKNCIKNKIKGQ